MAASPRSEAFPTVTGVPCRHCLRNVAAGDAYLILAHPTVPGIAALRRDRTYLPACAGMRTCGRSRGASRDAGKQRLHRSRPMAATTASSMAAAASSDGGIVARAEALFERDDIAYVHVRSARNNCYQCRNRAGLNRAQKMTADDLAGS